jgi:presenilin-like A22 family membrane protease
MFIITQLIGIFVVSQYSPVVTLVDGEEFTTYNLPYGLDPPEDVTPQITVISIVFALAIAVFIMFFLMRFNAEIILKLWFFIVVIIAIGISVNSFILGLEYSTIISIAIAFPLAIIKIFKRNIIVHNITELIIYPGIASIFVPILNIWSIVLLLILISLYDMYAVWHAGFMQKMAKYQIEKLKIFSGFFIPYIGPKQREALKLAKKAGKKEKKVKVSLAILGGGDIVFPIILAGVVLNTLGLVQALMISFGATIALAGLFYMSKKGKFYPAMPFITAGCFAALALAYLV